jgi:thiosulfate dehydrogenase
MKFLKESWFPVLLGLIILIVILSQTLFPAAVQKEEFSTPETTSSEDWTAPDIAGLPDDEQGRLIRYGHELIANTSLHLGPKGSVATISNGMNCQNCHIDAGEKAFAGCFSAVASTYPRYREAKWKNRVH